MLVQIGSEDRAHALAVGKGESEGGSEERGSSVGHGGKSDGGHFTRIVTSEGKHVERRRSSEDLALPRGYQEALPTPTLPGAQVKRRDFIPGANTVGGNVLIGQWLTG